MSQPYVYSTQLAAGNAVAGFNTVYTVPGAITTVLRDFELFLGNGLDDDLIWGVQVAGVQIPLSANYAVTGPVWLQWSTRIVLNAGDSIFTLAATGSFQFIASGYELRN